MRLQLLGDGEARDGDLYGYHGTKHRQGPQFIGSTLQHVAAEPCRVCPWPIVSREKDNILVSSVGRREILYLPYVSLACVPFYVDQNVYSIGSSSLKFVNITTS